MKRLLFALLFLATGIIIAILITTLTALWLVKADGKSFYQIISDVELIARFAMAIITFCVLLVLYIRFVFVPLAVKSFED